MLHWYLFYLHCPEVSSQGFHATMPFKNKDSLIFEMLSTDFIATEPLLSSPLCATSRSCAQLAPVMQK